MGCAICVPQDKIYIVETCGEFTKEAEPGFHCLPVPFVCSVAARMNMRVRPLIVSAETKTKDNVFVTVEVTVQYQVKKTKVYEAYYSLEDHQRQIRSYVFDVVRARVPKMTLDEVFESKDDVALAIQEELCQEMAQYGYEILNALVTDVSPDSKVRAAMNEINANKRLRLAAENKAEAEKIRVVKGAEAEAESQHLQGMGTARQRKAIVEGLKDSVGSMEKETGVDSRSVMDLILVTQYLDTLKDLAKGKTAKTVFVSDDPGPDGSLNESIRTSVIQGISGGFHK